MIGRAIAAQIGADLARVAGPFRLALLVTACPMPESTARAGDGSSQTS